MNSVVLVVAVRISCFKISAHQTVFLEAVGKLVIHHAHCVVGGVGEPCILPSQLVRILRP